MRGRPTKLTPELREKADNYLDWAADNGEIPSAVGLALYLDVTKPTVYNWAEVDKDFFYTLRKVTGKQEQLLINNGLAGKYNSTIAKLMLANHGYSDKQDITSGGDKLPTPILGGTSVPSSNGHEEDTRPTESN